MQVLRSVTPRAASCSSILSDYKPYSRRTCPPSGAPAADTPQTNPAVQERVSLLSGRQRLMRISWVAGSPGQASGPIRD
jgi:hypothetical protein